MHDWLEMPRTAIAELFHVRYEAIGVHIRQARELLYLLGRRPESIPVRPTSTVDLRRLIAYSDGPAHQEIKTAC